MVGLEPQPKPLGQPKIARQAQVGVGGYGAFAENDLIDAPWRDATARANPFCVRPMGSMRPMPAEAAAKEDRAASVTPAVRPTAPWRVQEVTALPKGRLFVRFVDGLTGIVDLSALMASPQAGVFARLRDRSLFEQVHVEMGAVIWPGELDLVPDAMRAAIKEHGEWRIAP
jgi:hypothetical protein